MNPSANQSSSASSAKRARRSLARILLAVAVVVVAFSVRPALTGFRAISLLLRIQNPGHWGTIARVGVYPLQETLTEVSTPSGQIRARLYIPLGAANPPAMVIVHGMHHLGIEEPRLVAFARAMAASGIRVLTPELAELADYRVNSGSIPLIGESARSLSASTGQKVGILGISFGGGLSLIAASEAQYTPYIRFVVTVGAHDDLALFSEFLITNRIVRPDGTVLAMQAHEYGPLVMIYSHLEDYFPPADLATAHDALRLLLWEQVVESKKTAAQLSAPSLAKMQLLYGGDVAALVPEMKQAVARHHDEMLPDSPHGQLATLHVPVLLLHGAADNVIPPTELLWLEQDVPHGLVKDALLSPAISHASIEGGPTLLDKVRLIRFMAKMLEIVDGTS